jgi:hypothetical protein
LLEKEVEREKNILTKLEEERKTSSLLKQEEEK